MPAPDDNLELLIVGYATGALDEQERRQFEAALVEHPEWLPIVEDARALAALSADRSTGDTTQEPSPDLLVDYVERRESLDRATIERIERLLERSEIGRGALESLMRLERDGQEQQAAVPLHLRLWERLRTSLLAPAPALGYLLLLVLLPALWFTLRDSGSGTLVPTRVEVVGERAIRDVGEGDLPVLTLQRDARFLQLELVTELTPGDLEGRSWYIELSESAGRSIERWPTGPNPRIFQGKARFDLILDTRALRSGRSYALTIATDAPGDPLDGQALFRRELRVE